MPARSRPPCTVAMIALLAAGVATATQAPDTQPAPSPTSGDEVVDRILTRLENREIHHLKADLTWRIEYVHEEPEDAQTKRGQIWYQQARPVSRFLVSFREKIVGGRRQVLDERHMFDGCWYVHLQGDSRHITRREIRRPTDPGDPFKLGQGPFPVPFGQRRADILREFEVRRIEPAPDDPPNTDHLELKPRPGTETIRTYKVVHFWIAGSGPEAGLPVRVRAMKLDGAGRVNSHITVTFQDARINEGFAPSVFRIDKPPGFDETVEPLPPEESEKPPASPDGSR